MGFLKVTYGKIFLTVLIFLGVILFFLPIKENVVCAIGETCPPINRLIRLLDVNETPEYSSINYWFLAAEFIISYIFSAAIVTLSGRGGSVNFVVKK